MYRLLSRVEGSLTYTQKAQFWERRTERKSKSATAFIRQPGTWTKLCEEIKQWSVCAHKDSDCNHDSGSMAVCFGR